MFHSPRAPICRWLLLGLILVPGCAGYHVGNDTLYPCQIRTVYVQMFESDSFRRNLSEWVTEAVVKEIELKTPYKVVSSPDADSLLTGRLVRDGKRVIVRNVYGDPRDTDVTLHVEVQWIDRQSQAILSQDTLPVPCELARISGDGEVVPEVGHSIATGQQAAVQRIAQQIVTMMESPW